MTALVALEAVQNGRASLHDKVVTSRAAALVGGSQVYLKQGETFTLAELLKALLIVSANDAAHAIAEHIAGSDRAFVQRMNARAKELGMTATRYYNPHGLPLASGHNVSSPLDMALLAREALKHTLLMQWAGTWTDTFRNGSFALANHNKLLRRVRGVDGLKTGYYSRAGFSSTVTVMRDGHRLIVVVIGTKLKTTRDECLKDLIEWGYRQPPVKP
jgi:D-alanyl-D-alanine carboxypeptidase (penicillin-binding protein 5/6)